MKTKSLCVLTLAAILSTPALAGPGIMEAGTWQIRFDLGVTIPDDPSLSLRDGPVISGDSMKLSEGFMMDAALGYRLAPWLLVEGEFGFTFNEVDSVGNWSYPDSFLNQLTMMVNLVIERPRGPLVPYAGVGAGGVLSSLTFGSYYYYYYSSSDGYGTDFVAAVQAFAGLRYEISEGSSFGLSYRFLATDKQKWDVDWWNGADFEVGVDAVRMHIICLTFTASF